MSYDEQVAATIRSWNFKFRGDANIVLRKTCEDLLNKDRNSHARLTWIINSSGMGKSRTVDELGKEIISVPMCLRQPRSSGFPPPDDSLRAWLLSSTPFWSSREKDVAQRKLHEFVYALLTVTLTALETIVKERQDISELPNLDNVDIGNMSEEERQLNESSVEARQMSLASAFRDQMTEGQSFQIPNAYRENFHSEVTALANKVLESPDQYISRDIQRLKEAAERLCRFIDPQGLLDRAKGPRRPLIVFAFDEAHTLTDNPSDISDYIGVRNLFFELHRVLQQIHKYPIFSLFLSTAGRFNLLSASPIFQSDLSNRNRDPNYCPFAPISEVGFDSVAYPAEENFVTLDQVVTFGCIAHFGRPLFGTRWDGSDRFLRYEGDEIHFAKSKLLCGPYALANNDRPGSLACLSVRFALEFTMDGTARDVVCEQVERHMRPCVAATTGLEKLVTGAGSEPLLAEAAYRLMKESGKNAVQYLAGHSDLSCIDRGRRGELVSTLLIMHAYDVARNGLLSYRQERWVPVISFMKALLPNSEHRTLCKSLPTVWRENEEKPFEETFEDYGMWFNHVVKIEDNTMISVDYLWKFVMRGAMILCANNQGGIDLVLPVCHKERNLSPDTMTAVLIRVKNAERFKKKINKPIFDAMSPFDLGIFPEDGRVLPKPVIRLVLALSSPEAGVIFPERASRQRHPNTFTAFDVWLAGLSTDTFNDIGGDLESYEALLKRSLRPHDAFGMLDAPSQGVDKQWQSKEVIAAACRQRMAPLILPEPGYHEIHQEKDTESTLAGRDSDW